MTTESKPHSTGQTNPTTHTSSPTSRSPTVQLATSLRGMHPKHESWPRLCPGTRPSPSQVPSYSHLLIAQAIELNLMHWTTTSQAVPQRLLDAREAVVKLVHGA
jgi:hypothetical protein